ncbi:MAG: CdaR family protein [Rubricoccaceae bacterium]|nr:CdaR family protein [Rubricoccaceae bacterium]
MKQDPFERLRELFPKAITDQELPADSKRKIVAVLCCFLVAFALWFTVSMRETYTVTVQSPISIVSLPAGQALTSSPPGVVNVQLQGVGWDLLALSRKPPEVRVSAEEAEVDLLQATVETSQLPAGVFVQSVQPQVVSLSLDSEASIRVPVELVGKVETEPPYGLIREHSLAPDSVTVTGARSILAEIDSWPTETVSLDGLRQPRSVSIALSDTLAGLVRLSEEDVRLTVHVAQLTEGSRMLTVVPINVPEGVSEVRFIPGRVRATYDVPTEGTDYDDAREAEDFYAFVDYADILSDTTAGTVPVHVRVPEGLLIQNVRLDPRRLEYFTVRE